MTRLNDRRNSDENDVRGGVIKEDIMGLQVGTDHKFLFRLQQHSACAVDNWPKTWQHVFNHMSSDNIAESYFGRPVVPLLKSIHNGASKERRHQLISPDEVRPRSAVRPSVTNASQFIQSLFHSAFSVA